MVARASAPARSLRNLLMGAVLALTFVAAHVAMVYAAPNVLNAMVDED